MVIEYIVGILSIFGVLMSCLIWLFKVSYSLKRGMEHITALQEEQKEFEVKRSQDLDKLHGLFEHKISAEKDREKINGIVKQLSQIVSSIATVENNVNTIAIHVAYLKERAGVNDATGTATLELLGKTK